MAAVAAAAAAESGGDRFIARSPSPAPETEYQRDVRDLVDFLSKLNPSAKEFIPSNRSGGGQGGSKLSADAPSFTYCTNRDSSSDGSSSKSLPPNRRRRSGNGQGQRRYNERNWKEEQIRRTVYVSDIDQNVTEESLAGFFKYFGDVVDCRVCGDPHSALRFAFIEFSKTSEARAALQAGVAVLGYYHVKVLPSKTAIVPVNPRFLPRSEDEKEMVGRTIYCTNIDKKVSQTEVKAFFEKYCGEVKRLRLLLDNKHTTCIAFVEFAQAESANSALNYSGAVLGSIPIRVSPSKTPVRPRIPRAASH